MLIQHRMLRNRIASFRIALFFASFVGCVIHSERILAAEEPKDGLEFFEKRIRPVLVQHCYKCHSSEIKVPKGGLRLDSREGLRAGGDSGHAVVPGEEDESLLLSALRYEQFEMPPAGPLDDAIIEDFAEWVRMGAPDPRDAPASTPAAPINIEAARQAWTYRPPVAQEPPASVDDWPRTDVDRFIRAAQIKMSISPVADADRATLLRRVTFDLTGLPPTSEEVEAFLQDASAEAYEKVVDRLLRSPAFGERWARHWLDVARYSESMGRTRNVLFPEAWRYRDYVIDAFQNDKPYDQFLREQLAGDLLPADNEDARREQLVATGFLALGSHDLNERNRDIFQMDVVGEQVDTVSRAVMGLTIGCARCHDHKFDPIPTRDYYALAGIFASTELMNGYTNRRRMARDYDQPDRLLNLTQLTPPTRPVVNPPLVEIDAQAIRRARDDYQAARKELASLRTEIEKRMQEGIDRRVPRPVLRRNLGELRRRQAELQARVKNLRERLSEAQETLASVRAQRDTPPVDPGNPNDQRAMGVVDSRRVRDCPIYVQGEIDQVGELVPRGFPQVLASADSPTIPRNESGRRELAEWLTRPEHPLTARVYVNRVWQHLFGRGIVASVDNFGQSGEQPTHPELLDYLAVKFVHDGWSVKRLVRELVLSRTYQLSGDDQPQAYEIDGENRYLWRMSPRRLEAEAIRDAMLAMSGKLNTDRPVGSIVQTIDEAMRPRRVWERTTLDDFAYRSIYLPIMRDRVPEFLTTLDFPEPSEVRGQREVSTVATQSLWFMNSPFVLNQAQAAAARMISEKSDPTERMRLAYLRILGRLPSLAETEAALEFVKAAHIADDPTGDDPTRAERKAWADLAQSLMACAEFRYR